MSLNDKHTSLPVCYEQQRYNKEKEEMICKQRPDINL